MRFAKWVFLLSGVYGVLLLTPMFFLEERLGQDNPPAITHPEFYYGFVGAVLAWQIMYLMIGFDPARYRMVMLLGAAAKASFGLLVCILYREDRVAGSTVAIAMPDVLMAVLFVAAWLRVPSAWRNPEAI